MSWQVTIVGTLAFASLFFLAASALIQMRNNKSDWFDLLMLSWLVFAFLFAYDAVFAVYLLARSVDAADLTAATDLGYRLFLLAAAWTALFFLSRSFVALMEWVKKVWYYK